MAGAALACPVSADDTADITQIKLAHEGGTQPLATTPVVGTPDRDYPPTLVAGTEPVADGEVRVTILGSGDPFVKVAQACASVLIEVGNKERDIFLFDLGAGSLANFNGLKLPVAKTTKLFLTHLHADHVGDIPTLIWSLAKSGRSQPIEVWGPSGETEALGTKAYTQHIEAAHAWDMATMEGHPGQGGARTVTTEIPYDKSSVVYDRNGVKISSFPVDHALPGAVGYRIDYNDLAVVFSGDTRPTESIQEACEGGVDLLIHETFPSAEVFARKAGLTEKDARKVIDKIHTSPTAVGQIFQRAGARMSVLWHFSVDHETVGPAHEQVRAEFDGPFTIAQDLTVFDITRNAVVVRQAIIDSAAWPVTDGHGKSKSAY
jgi:ribonuclease Z